ncbi:MAG: hypothetical protein FJX34_01815 [Alphaproteobacteria bacterium]|nr:hypothetical protein [Alphaproteobacteria bacterium]
MMVIFLSLLLLVSTIAFLRTKDVLVTIQIIKITNFYIIPLLLIGIVIEHFSFLSLSKIIALILLNILVTHLLCHLLTQRSDRH